MHTTSQYEISSYAQKVDWNLLSRLSEIYGDDAEVQSTRYSDALSAFRTRFGAGPVALFRAPGRINLIGGHTDYNHGYVLPVALDRDVLLLARQRDDRSVHLANIEDEFPEDDFALDDVTPRPGSPSWTNYVRGAVHVLSALSSPSLQGIDGLVVGAAPFGVPRGSGLSSSTALTVAAVMALSYFAGLGPAREHIVQLGSDAEWFVGTRGGIMDQYASLFARRNHALFLDCRPAFDGAYTSKSVPLPDEYEIIVAESGVRHDNVRGGYNLRVAACRTGVGILRERWPHVTHLRDMEAVEWSEVEPLLPEELSVADALAAGYDIGDIPGLQPDRTLHVRACCRHIWEENHRVIGAFQALEAGDVSLAGQLISAAHASARDNYGISFPEMETMIATAATVSGVAGGRITGAGWGGCAVFLVQRDAKDALCDALEDTFRLRHGRSPAIFPCRSGTSAGLVATVTV